MHFEEWLLISSVLLFASVMAWKIASWSGIPALLLFIGIGMLAGSDGPGGIYFDSAFSLRSGLLCGPRFSIVSGNDGSSRSKMVRGSDILIGGTVKDSPPRPLWRNRDFLLLWSGQTISVLGTNISTLALPLLVLVLTHSPALAGLLTAMRLLPYLLFSLPAGALIDRWDRKAVMIRCDIVRWLALGSVPLAFSLGYLTIA